MDRLTYAQGMAHSAGVIDKLGEAELRQISEYGNFDSVSDVMPWVDDTSEEYVNGWMDGVQTAADSKLFAFETGGEA